MRPAVDVDVDAGAGASKSPSPITTSSGMHHVCQLLGVSSSTLEKFGSHERLEAQSQVRREPPSRAQLVEVAHCRPVREPAPLFVGMEEQSKFRRSKVTTEFDGDGPVLREDDSGWEGGRGRWTLYQRT